MNLWTKVYIVFINFVETLLLIFTFMNVKKNIYIHISIDSTLTIISQYFPRMKQY